MSEIIVSNKSSGRIPPHNINAEKSILGAMILSTRACAAAIQGIRGSDFYIMAHQRIFDAMIALSNAGKNIDLITLSDRLDMDGALEAVGDYAYLVGISEFVPTISNVDQYITIVKNDSILRNLIEAAGKITDDCYNDDKETSDVIANAEKAIFDISQSDSSKNLIHIREATNDVIRLVEERYANPGAITGVRTGFAALDSLLTGLQPAELVLIASRPGMGKTAFALNVAKQAALLDNAKIAIFSLEMPYSQLAERLLSSTGKLSLHKIKTGLLDENDWEKLIDSSDSLGECAIYIDDTSGITITEIMSKCRRMKIEHGLSMVFIDYLQLIGSGSKKESRLQEISEMTRMLKIMAMDIGVPIVLLSQLSRAPEQRADHRPLLSDLRESGTIEQDADIVMFVYREGYYQERDQNIDPEKITNVAEISIAKHRSGPTGVIKLTWDGETVTFKDVDSHHGSPN